MTKKEIIILIFQIKYILDIYIKIAIYKTL